MLTETKEGLILPVRVTPKARENKIVGWRGDELKIKVMAPPEKGAANRSLVSLLAKHLKLPQRDIILMKGDTSRHKLVCLVGLTI